jgi:hypothetical protein
VPQDERQSGRRFTMAEERRPPKVQKGPPLPWTEERVPDEAKPELPTDQEQAAAAFRRDARRKRPRLLDAEPGE